MNSNIFYLKAGQAIMQGTTTGNLSSIILSLVIPHFCWGIESTVFTWEKNFPRIHCSLEGSLLEDNWYAREVNTSDNIFYKSLFGNEEVMGNFGDGKTRSPEAVQARLDLWHGRFDNGQPMAA